MTREEAIEIVQAIKFIDDFEDYSDRLEIALDMSIEALKDRPHGEWIVSMSNTRCSNCGYNGKTVETTNFCPNCGADMRKEGDTNDQL